MRNTDNLWKILWKSIFKRIKVGRWSNEERRLTTKNNFLLPANLNHFPYLCAMLRFILFIGIGGFIGSVARYYFAGFVQAKMLGNWPYGTFAVNLIGCFLIGLIYAVGERTVMSPEWRLFLATGLCGGLTTFSSFSFEIVDLLRGGQFLPAFTYAAFSLLLGIVGVWAGLAAVKLLF